MKNAKMIPSAFLVRGVWMSGRGESQLQLGPNLGHSDMAEDMI